MATDPGFDPQKAMQAGLRAVEQGRPQEAVQIAEETLRRAGKYPGAYFLKAWALRAMGDIEAAIGFARKAEKAGGRDPLSLNLLGLLYREAGKPDLARRAWQDALRKEPRALDAVLGIARLDTDLGQFDAAYAGFEKALSMAPHHADTLASYADAKQRGGAHEEAGRLAEHALHHAPEHPLALAVWAGEALKTQAPEAVIARLESGLAAGKGHVSLRAKAYGRLGEALEKAGRHDDAFDHFAEANRLVYRSAVQAWNEEEYSLRHVTAVLRALRDLEAVRPGEIEAKAPPAPVFVTGFPGSGVEEAGRLLAAQPRGVLAQGQETAATLLDAAGRTEESWRDFLAMTPQRRTGLRRAFWKAARPEGALSDGRVLVDADPVHLGFVAALGAVFPDARFIVMTRDPRDAVLTAFRERPAPTASTVQFLTIDTAAAWYDAQHRALERAMKVLPELKIRFQPVEALAADPEGESRAMAEFAGLEMADPPAAGDAGWPRGGVWRPYEAKMAGAIRILRDWTGRWGRT